MGVTQLTASLDQVLFRHDQIETQQLKLRQFVPDYPEIRATTADARLTTQDVLGNGDFQVAKHHRFAAYPLHSHQFLELNYMYAGHCKQVVDGQPVELSAGDVLVLDTGSSHAIDALNEGDILINFLVKVASVNLNTIAALDQAAPPAFVFIRTALNCEGEDHQNFMILCAKHATNLTPVLKSVLREAYFPSGFSAAIIKAYLPIIFLELSRAVHVTVNEQVTQSHEPIIPVLQAIEQNYAKLTLQQLAHDLGYNRNYLSNLIKKKTGRTYSEIVRTVRLKQAYRLLTTSSLSLNLILKQVGMSNRTAFYREFEALFGVTPHQLRAK